MGKTVLSFAVGAAFILTATGVQAQSWSSPTAVNWSGFYLGGHFGWAGTDVAVQDVDSYNGAGLGNFGYDADDIFGGVQIGYNIQNSGFVYGIEGDFGGLGFDESQQYPPYVGVRDPDDSRSSIDGGYYGTIAGRLGFAFNGILVYAKAGWGFADVDVNYIDTDPTGLTLVSGTRKSETLDGAVYGGGLEFAVGTNASIKFEYLRLDFDQDITVSALDSIGITRRFVHEVDSIDTVRVGFNLRLDHERYTVAPLK